MDKYITHKAYTWANEFNKYIKDILKGKTKEERDEQIKKLLDEKDKKIEELKTVIDKSDKRICEDIEREPNPKRCFLIIGEDEDLIECIVTYIFCFYLNKAKLFFNSEDFTGNDDETIKEKLIYQGDSSTWIRQGIYLTNPSYLKLIDLMDGIEASRRDLLLYFQYGGTLFLRNLKSQDHEMLKCIAMKIREIVTKNADSHGTLIVSTDNKDNLSDYFTNQFEIIPLGQDKQSRTEDISQVKAESVDSNIKNKTLFFDDNTNYLWFSEDKKTRIEEEDAKLIKAMLDMTEKENRHCCRKEEIILKAYGVTVGINQKIPQKIANKLNTSKSTIKKKCKLDLNIKELIQKDGVKLLKFSINVERRKL